MNPWQYTSFQIGTDLRGMVEIIPCGLSELSDESRAEQETNQKLYFKAIYDDINEETNPHKSRSVSKRKTQWKDKLYTRFLHSSSFLLHFSHGL